MIETPGSAAPVEKTLGWRTLVLLVLVVAGGIFATQRRSASKEAACREPAAKQCSQHADCGKARVERCRMDAFNAEFVEICERPFVVDCDERHWNRGISRCNAGQCSFVDETIEF